MSEAVHPVPDHFQSGLGPEKLAELRRKAADNPDAFFLEQARRLDWSDFPTKAGDWAFDEENFHIEWFADGTLNLSVNCLDRHLAERGDRVALIFEPDEPGTGPGQRSVERPSEIPLTLSERRVPLIERRTVLAQSSQIVRVRKREHSIQVPASLGRSTGYESDVRRLKGHREPGS